jgi:uncharacterized membrane protein YdbT with pleckstrin-like domain
MTMSYLESLMSTAETVQVVRRTHWISLVRAAVLYGLSIAVLVLASGIGFGYANQKVGDAVGVLLLILVLLPLYLLVRDVAQWYSRIYVVTTRRVMQMSGVLNKRVSDSNLDKVNDVVLTQSVVGRILGYGDIEIITGSDVGVDVFQRIEAPVEFKRVMLDNKEDFDTLARMTAQQLREPPGDDEDVPTALDRLASLRDRGVISEDEFEAKKAELLARL